MVILGGGIMGQEAILKPKIRKALKEGFWCQALLKKTRLEFAHHQNTAGMLGAYYHFKTKQYLVLAQPKQDFSRYVRACSSSEV